MRYVIGYTLAFIALELPFLVTMLIFGLDTVERHRFLLFMLGAILFWLVRFDIIDRHERNQQEIKLAKEMIEDLVEDRPILSRSLRKR